VRQMLSVLLSAALVALGGCATVLRGDSQTISVTTDPPGARCTLTRQGQTIAVVEQTPADVDVRKSKNDIDIACSKFGYDAASATDGSVVSGAVYGNILLVTAGADAATGAANEYDHEVNLTLKQRRLLGVGVAALEDAPPTAGGPKLDHGVLVTVVVAGSAAAEAGLSVGDILVSMDGEPVAGKGDIQRIIGTRDEGAIVAVHVIRNGRPMDVAVKV
jgi:membrane-associated protease RseP (regulator of RpoE activity)